MSKHMKLPEIEVEHRVTASSTGVRPSAQAPIYTSPAFVAPEISDACKTVLANIQFTGIDEEITSVTITSPSMGDGKTTVSVGLALAAASSGLRVLLLDADLRHRCIAKLLGVRTTCGFPAVLRRDATLDEAIVPTGTDGLFFLDGEPDMPSPTDLLGSKRFAAMIKSLCERFDYVIVDTPPLDQFVDAAHAGSACHGTLLVTREKKTDIDAIEEAINQLRIANARILGTVFVRSTEMKKDYYSYYYRKDGRSGHR